MISSLLLVSFIASFIYVFNVIKNKNRHTSVVSMTLEKKMVEKGNIRTLESKMSELEDINEKIASFFVETSKIDTFVEYLENMGIDNDVALVVKTVEPVKNDKNKIFVSLNMSGEFPNILKIIAELENSPYYLKINTTYLNKEIEKKIDETVDVKGGVVGTKDVTKKSKSIWQANVTFSVVSL